MATGVTDLRKGWFADFSPARGKLITGSGGGGGTGTFYAEATVVAANAGHKVVFGVCTASFAIATDFTASGSGFDNTAGSYAALAGGLFAATSGAGGNTDGWGDTIAPPAVAAVSVGNVLGLAIDTANKLMWLRNASVAPTTWYGGAGATNANIGGGAVGGLDISSLGSPYYLLVGLGSENFGTIITPQITINLGGSAFTAAAPTTFSAWGATDTLDPAHANAGLTFAGGNLTISRATQDTSQPGRFTRTVGAH